MSVALLPAERAQYSAIIDDILASGNLETISAKQIRKGLQEKLAVDISDKKSAVQTLILERFDRAQTKTAAVPSTETNGKNGVKPEKRKASTPPSSTPGVKSEASDDEISPPKKKRKPTSSSSVKKELDDESYAKMLQEQENRSSRATRGAAKPRKSGTAKRTPKKKKSADKVKAEDDSEIEVGSDGEVKEKVRKGGFHKAYHLSAPLADLVGEPTLSRPQVVKKIWEYIKARDLQDPADKRQIRCDQRLYTVFKQDKVHMFTMNKLLSKQLYEVEEE